MAVIAGRAATREGARYAQQLCKHWSHKFEVEPRERGGLVRMGAAAITLDAAPDAVLVTIEAEDPEAVERLKGVVATHLDRFAFREAPLTYEWSA